MPEISEQEGAFLSLTQTSVLPGLSEYAGGVELMPSEDARTSELHGR